MPDAIHSPPRPPKIPPHERFDRPVEFVRHDLKTPLWGKQAQILRAIKRNRRTAVRSSNGSGKTFVAATAVIWWLMAHPYEPAMVVTTAPTQHQVRDLLWREIRSLYAKNATLIGGTLGRTTLEIDHNHYATGLSTDSPERFQGFHETNILFVVDEASGVREQVFDAIEGSMTSRRARLLLIGNPTSLAGTFYKAFHQRRTQYKTIHISAFDTPNLSATANNKSSLLREGVRGRVDCSGDQVTTVTPGANEDRGGVLPRDAILPAVETDAQQSPDTAEQSREAAQAPPQTGLHMPIPGIVQPQWVHEASTTWSKNSAQYQVRVLGEFPTQADDTLIPLTQIEAAISNGSDPTPAHRTNSTLLSNVAARLCHCEESDDVAVSNQNRNIKRLSQQRSCPSQPQCHPEPVEGRQTTNNSNSANHLDLTQPIHIGVDIARFGTDRTVICIRQDKTRKSRPSPKPTPKTKHDENHRTHRRRHPQIRTPHGKHRRNRNRRRRPRSPA